MRIWGKLLGFLFGFMLTKNIFGALLGLWLGHRFDKGVALISKASVLTSRMK